MSTDHEGWLLVSASTGKDASLRVFVWRQLRKLGAVYVGPSVCLLPDLPVTRDAVARLVSRVQDQGGRARVLTVGLRDQKEEDALRAEQRAERDVEYAEVVERAPQLLAELEQETARGRATYTEVEESEADLERFHRWLASIEARDYFNAPGRAAAAEAVERCREALAAFEATAVDADLIAAPHPQHGDATKGEQQ
jgi:hypothetical protein